MDDASDEGSSTDVCCAAGGALAPMLCPSDSSLGSSESSGWRCNSADASSSRSMSVVAFAVGRGVAAPEPCDSSSSTVSLSSIVMSFSPSLSA